MAVKKKAATKKKKAEKDTLVHIQADEQLVMRLKIITASRNKKMYETVNEALSQWLCGQTQELEEIADLFKEYV
ncbi:MAG: hypothetical protein HOM11_13765 [Methylococcales bacterium]|jgi:hypothetical protein|nr:hypothetical protein [Methylococcales bacterium]MBT7444794.1 hypothetical protein [Methylococcales bacterium]